MRILWAVGKRQKWRANCVSNGRDTPLLPPVRPRARVLGPHKPVELTIGEEWQRFQELMGVEFAVVAESYGPLFCAGLVTTQGSRIVLVYAAIASRL